MKSQLNKVFLKLHPDKISRVPINKYTRTYANKFTNGDAEVARFRLVMVANLTPKLLNTLSAINPDKHQNQYRKEIYLLNLITRQAKFDTIQTTQAVLRQILKEILSPKRKKLKYSDIT